MPHLPLERLIQQQGFGSRKECRALIRHGHVAVDGDVCENPFAEFETEGLHFQIDGEDWCWREHAYLALNKPAGYECSRNPIHHPSVLSLLPPPLLNRGVQPVGRLDEDTTGLLLLTDDGQFIHALTSPRREMPKVYEVTLRHAIDETQIQRLLAGVVLRDDPQAVAAAACEAVDSHRLRLTITGGRYHQVKRMVAAIGNRVEALHRAAIGDFALPAGLAPGQWQWITPEEVGRLTKSGG
ncbi:16S rRNA pseudouridine(516) synthase [Denitratisoma sp. DHT3]|uniref:pseudouridine synthase n=1 Tax=Denitratisoma sp. DHT3 TaxID=1981880 RepID=UPI00119899AB|nr:16S rRNA pseudouridine(516) synthase [Denitratisoma sp. DHT3]QDX80725.1 16S rRNA pseudouridine(516) synthase [Denitratisoma sp. DHT3]